MPQPPEHIVGARGERDQLFRRGRANVRPAEPGRRLERPILVEDNAGRNQHGPGEIVLKAVGRVSVRGKREHVRRIRVSVAR